MKTLFTLTLALSGMLSFTVVAADVRVKSLVVSTAVQGPVANPQAFPQFSIRHILIPHGQPSNCKDAN